MYDFLLNLELSGVCSKLTVCDKNHLLFGTRLFQLVDLDGKILYIAEKYSNIGKVKSITENISTMGMYSIDNIIDAIKNY